MFGLSVLIQRGWQPSALVFLLCWSLAALPLTAEEAISAATAQVEVNLRLAGPDSVAAPLRLEVESAEPGGSSERQVYELAGPTRLSISFRPPGRLQVASEAPYWAPDVALLPDMSQVDVELWPVALVSGAFAEGHAAPPRLSLGFQPVRLDPKEKPKAQPRGTVDCVPGRTFACRLPAATLDLRLEVEGYVPLYFWNRQLKSGSKLDLGLLKLEKGASVAGWVDLPVGIAPGDIEVVLEIAATGFLGDPVLGTQLKRKRREVKVDPSGFFQIVGAEPGPFSVFARTPGRPDGPKIQIHIRRDEESVLGTPLELPEPGRLRVWISPGAGPWRFTLLARQARSQFAQDVKTERPEDSGWLELVDLPVGSFRYQVTDDDGGIWKSGELEIVPGENPPLLIEIPQVEIAGKVLLGNEPVAAKILFGAMGEQQIPIDSDQDGKFHGFLPREGRWEMAAELAEAGYVRLEPVDVEEKELDLILRIPGVNLEGIVFEDGKPKAAALVIVKDEGGKGRVLGTSTTNGEGKFRLAGLAAGTLGIMAKRADRQSKWTIVEAEVDQEAEKVRIELLESNRVRGRVLVQGTPLSAAKITAIPNPSHLGRSSTVSGIDGTFEVLLPAEAADAVLIGLAQGYAAAIEPAPIRSATISLSLSTSAGDLLVGGLHCRPGSHTLVYGSVRIDLFDLFVTLLAVDQAIEGLESITFQSLPVGQYLLCDNRTGNCLAAVVPLGGQASLKFGS
jgi:hypothetical protein